VKAQGGQKGLAAKITEKTGEKIGQSGISAWYSERKIPVERRAVLEEMGWRGPWEWPKGQMSDLLRPLAPMDDQAAAILEEMVFKGRPWHEDQKREMAEFVAEQMLELQMVGYLGHALEKEIRDRIRQWLKIASGPEIPGEAE